MQTRRFLIAAALFAAAGLAVEAPPAQADRPRPPKPNAVKMPRLSFSKYRPHQGKRECARRRGGQDWADWKSADRVSRGLPA